MAVESKNSSLGAAKSAKNDEFYTQWADIEREMNAVRQRGGDVHSNGLSRGFPGAFTRRKRVQGDGCPGKPRSCA